MLSFFTHQTQPKADRILLKPFKTLPCPLVSLRRRILLRRNTLVSLPALFSKTKNPSSPSISSSMATSIASQLKAIKSIHKGTPDPIKGPLTRPSILFNPKEAADIDLRTIHSHAISGLEGLIEIDNRFRRYKDTLFSQTSLDLDREKMVQKEEDKLNRSICSYLRLLSGYFELPASLKMMEYLIRRYKVHVFNVDELVLCALPYHETHAFVRIVQLLDLGDKKWAFLEGIKTSGAPPPRKVIVQQCIQDKGILETLCEYAKPTSEFHHAKPVICFCTAVIMESLGSIPKLDTDTVKRVLPFVFNGLNPDMKGSRDHKAGALMVVSLLAVRATLAPKLVQSLAFFIAKVAEHDAKQSADLPWIRVTIMAIVTLVQSQTAQIFSKKTVMILKEIRDFAAVLSRLSREFNIEKFLCLYLETLVDYSTSDDSYMLVLISMLETLQMKEIVEKVVSKLLVHCKKLSQSKDSSNLHQAGERAKRILVVIERQYPSELHGAVRKFLEHSRMNLKEGDSSFKTFCLMFDEGLALPNEIPDSKFWFSLEHPKAEVRRAALSGIVESGILKNFSGNPQKLLNVQNAIVRRLHDDDLSVIQAALSVGLAGVVDSPCLLRACRAILFRCIPMINGGTSAASLASNVAELCLERMVLDVPLHNSDYSKEVSTIIFPLLVVRPKTWRLNLKALELTKQIQWPFYIDANIACDPTPSEKAKIHTLDSGSITAINLKTIEALAKTFRREPGRHIQWLVECSRCNELAKSLFFLIILQASAIHNEDSGNVLKLHQVCSTALKDDWHERESLGRIALTEEFMMDKFDQSCKGWVDQLLSTDVETVNIKILICIYWYILKACNTLADDLEQPMILDELFLFFTTLPSKNIFKKHLHFLVKNCSRAPFQFLCKFFAEGGFPVEVQVESLHLLATLCSIGGSLERSSMNENSYLQFILGFPSLLIPLSHANKDIRTAAGNCIEGIYKLWHQFDASRLKNGNDTTLSCCLLTPAFGEFLESIMSHKQLISSDASFLPSFLMSMLSASTHSLVVPENINKRFDQASKEAILLFILSSAIKFSSHGKLVVLSLFKGWGNAILHVEGVKILFFELLERRYKLHMMLDKSGQELSKIEIETLCLLLEICVHPSNSVPVASDITHCLIKALKVDFSSSDDPAIVQPCIAVLQNLSCSFYEGLEDEIQDELFGDLVSLFRNDNGDIRNATRETVLRLNFGCSTIARLFDLIIGWQDVPSKRIKLENFVARCRIGVSDDLHNGMGTTVCLLGSLLDILLLKKHIERRDLLIQPLFQVLERLFSKEWLLGLANQGYNESVSWSDIPELVTGGIYHAQQTVLLILKDITDSLLSEHLLKEDFSNKFKIDLLVECVRSTEDVAARNHIFLLLSSIAKASPRLLSEYMFDIFTIIGESAVKQIDSHSQRITEDLISTLVPCWLSATSSIGELLKIFIRSLPDVLENRRLTLMVYLLRSLGEKDSLGVLVFHLLSSLIYRTSKSSNGERNMHDTQPSSHMFSEWEYIFAVQLTDQYSSEIWLPCLVKFLQEIKMQSEREELFLMLHIAMQFILHKLEDTELFFQLESAKNADYLQVILGSLMEQVVLHLQLVTVQSKQVSFSKDAIKKLKNCSDRVLKKITMWMLPLTYFQCITRLLDHADGNVKKKALALLCETIKNQGLVQRKCSDKRRVKQSVNAQIHLDKKTASAFDELCLKIVQLISCNVDCLETPVKLAAISSLEILSKELPSDNLMFSMCLACIVKYIGSSDLATSSASLRSTGALVNVLGSKSLSHLPHIMRHVLERAHEISKCPIGNSKYSHIKTYDGALNQKLSLHLSIITTLEAVIENLGGFLNPYLEDILDLIILHPEYIVESDAKMKVKTAAVRKLLTEKIPVRLMLTPLLKIYSSSLICGESSLCLVFEMLSSIIGVMDRPSIGTYHVKIFDQCLIALDIRRRRPESVKNIKIAEQSVLNSMIVLSMKLTESMFRPLFIHSLEWADCVLEESGIICLDRMITYYEFINKLVEKHRSLFVPYFKYLLEGCTRHLTEDPDVGSVPSIKKRKKAKHGDAQTLVKVADVVSPKQWHLRALILKSLYQCFLYDTTDLKFLDASNFQVLLKPIVSQIVVEPPTSTDVLMDVPTVEEVDQTLVLCLGQMAVTAHSDVLWKPLNHEVLMQTRSEKMRPKILGLKVVKYLVEHLKEEYLIFLPETIPFLGELIEDVELPVKALAQEILKEMETLSGENLQQYL